MKFDVFTQAYIQAALWSSTDDSDPTGGEPLDKNYSIKDIAPKTLKRMVKDCQRFQEVNWELLTSEPGSEYLRGGELSPVLERAGQDFWLTRNGHGAGFWDGDWPVNGDALTKASNKYGEYNLYVGDDGKIYGS
jgi:hypothetical protein